MGVQTEIIIPRYVVLTRLADSWIPRASHGNPESAEAEAFRWRRIYGPNRTRVAEFMVPELVRESATLPALYEPPPAVTVSAEPVGTLRYATPGLRQPLSLQDAALRGLALYLGFGFANRVMELLIVLAQH